MIISDPECRAHLRQETDELLSACMMPGASYTAEAAPGDDISLNAMCRRIVMDEPVPLDALHALLRAGGKRPACLRKAVSLHQSLALCLPPERSGLLIAEPDEMGCVSMPLPEGKWTEMGTGEVYEKRYVRMCPEGFVPVLIPQNALLPILPDDLSGNPEMVTLHWFQPEETAGFTAKETVFHAAETAGGTYVVQPRGCHLILHKDEQEIIIC